MRRIDMSLGDFTLVQERSLPIFLIVDTSKSMTIDNRIGRVNGAIHNMLDELRNDMTNAQENLVAYQVGIIAFGGGEATLQPLQDVRTIEFVPLHAAGDTPLGDALDMLLDQVKKIDKRSYAPCIVLLSDGNPWIQGNPHYFDEVCSKLKEFQKEKRIARSQLFSVKVGPVSPKQDRFLLDFVQNNPQHFIDAAEVGKIKDAFELITLSVTQQASTIAFSPSKKEDADAESIRIR